MIKFFIVNHALSLNHVSGRCFHEVTYVQRTLSRQQISSANRGIGAFAAVSYSAELSRHGVVGLSQMRTERRAQQREVAHLPRHEAEQ